MRSGEKQERKRTERELGKNSTYTWNHGCDLIPSIVILFSGSATKKRERNSVGERSANTQRIQESGSGTHQQPRQGRSLGTQSPRYRSCHAARSQDPPRTAALQRVSDIHRSESARARASERESMRESNERDTHRSWESQQACREKEERGGWVAGSHRACRCTERREERGER